jgi:D-alanyl-D-alanine carboxypeptidase
VGGKIRHKLVNINELLGEVEGVLGVKTGWTENARENLVTYIERDGHSVMITLLGSQDRFGETKELINWIFENYSWEEVKFP